MQGQVVGINTAGDDSAQNIGFAIAIDSVKQTIADAEAHPLAASAYLGVVPQTVTTDLAFQFGLKVDHGAYVAETTTDGPAVGAGIRQGDVIVSIDGKQVASDNDVGTILNGLKPGDRVPVEVVGSDGTTRTVEVTLGTRPSPAELP
jgi:S1-C subfamily serine protease